VLEKGWEGTLSDRAATRAGERETERETERERERERERRTGSDHLGHLGV